MRKAGEELATKMEEEPSTLVDTKEDSYNIPVSQKEDPIDILLEDKSGDNFSEDNMGIKSRDKELALRNTTSKLIDGHFLQHHSCAGGCSKEEEEDVGSSSMFVDARGQIGCGRVGGRDQADGHGDRT